MSFVQTLWTSLTQTYSLPDRTALASKMATQERDKLRKQEDAALQQLGPSHTPQKSNCSPAQYPQSQQPQQSQPQQSQLQQSQQSHHMNPQYVYYYPGMRHYFYTTQYPQQYSGAYPYTTTYGYGYGGYAASQQAQYGCGQPTTSSPTAWLTSPHVAPYSVPDNGQGPSVHWGHGGDAYSQGQEQQQQQPPPSPSSTPLPPPPPPPPLLEGAQQQYVWPARQARRTVQPYSTYDQQATLPYNSYLNSIGVPFDLQPSNARLQLTHGPDRYGNHEPSHTTRQSGTRDTFYNALAPSTQNSNGFKTSRDDERYDRSLGQGLAIEKDLFSRSTERSRSWRTASHASQAQHTLRTPEKPAQLLEHSVDSNGTLHTTVHEMCTKTIESTANALRHRVPKTQPQGSIKHIPGTRKHHVPFEQLSKLIGRSPLSVNKQARLDLVSAWAYAKPASQMSAMLGNDKKEQAAPIFQYKHSNVSGVHRLVKTYETDTSRVYHRFTTNSSSPLPPTKRVKADSAASSSPKVTTTNAKNRSTSQARPTAGGWSNFTAHIAQDDKNMALKARENLDQLGGETFRPEFRETYKDQKGKKESTVHEKSGGKADPSLAAQSQCEAVVKRIESKEKDVRSDGVFVDRAYDTDSSGGVVLSPFDLDNDAWVVINGDEDATWKRG